MSTTPAHAVDVDEACEGAETGIVTDPWDVVTEWSWPGSVAVAPVIGNLNDDDGDGVIDDHDTPDVVGVDSGGHLFALDGATGAVEWTSSNFDDEGGVAIADVDGDGLTDVVALAGSRYPVAVAGDGTLEWTSNAMVTEDDPHVTVADVDEDGTPEVISGDWLLDGVTGALEASVATDARYWVPAAGDLDQDGQQEILSGENVYDSRGNLLWKAAWRGPYGHMDAILDADGDPGAEVAMLGGGHYTLFDTDGTVLVDVAGPDQPGPPCVADFDGDGRVEIAWPDQTKLEMHELDGTLDWWTPIMDASGLAGCSGYDVDGDGAYEVLFADEHDFWILDGKTGDVRFDDPSHSSITLEEYPTVADVDGDGSAEILVAGSNGVVAYGQVDGTWLGAGRTWATHDFAVTNVEPDGHIPATPEAPWQTYNVYRARPAQDVREPLPDLVVSVDDVCVASCEGDGPIEIAWHVENVGPIDVPPGIDVTLYRLSDDAPIARAMLPAVPAGEALEGQAFEVAPADLGDAGFEVRADALGHLSECRRSNDVWRLAEPLCE